MIKYREVKERELQYFKLLFLIGDLDLYTKKNELEMVKLDNLTSVNRYRYRLYVKEVN